MRDECFFFAWLARARAGGRIGADGRIRRAGPAPGGGNAGRARVSPALGHPQSHGDTGRQHECSGWEAAGWPARPGAGGALGATNRSNGVSHTRPRKKKTLPPLRKRTTTCRGTRAATRRGAGRAATMGAGRAAEAMRRATMVWVVRGEGRGWGERGREKKAVTKDERRPERAGARALFPSPPRSPARPFPRGDQNAALKQQQQQQNTHTGLPLSSLQAASTRTRHTGSSSSNKKNRNAKDNQ